MPEKTIHLVPVLDEEVLAIGRRLLPAGFTLETVTKADLPAKLPDVEFLLGMEPGWIDDDALLAATKLKLIQLMNVGYDSFNVEGARKARVPVAVNGGANAISVAEHAVMFILALIKRLSYLDQNVRAGKWRGGPMGALRVHEVWSQTVGIVGMGRIGQNVAARLRPFEPGEIVYYDPVRPSAEREKQLGVRYLPMDELLKVSDIVTLHVPLMPETRNMIDGRALKLMKPTAVLVNTARGPIVDQKALSEALRAGTIFAAGLDVTDPEPPDPSDPLLHLPNVVVAPHIASATVGTRNAMADICANNLLAGLTGQPLPAWVNPEVASRRRA